MRLFQFCILMFCYQGAVFALPDTIAVDKHSFVYTISNAWWIHSSTDNGASIDVILKRYPISDKQGVKVIPNILIKLVRVTPSSSETDADNQLFTQTMLLNFAPPEVLKDYEAKRSIKYQLPLANSYSFNSPYRDNSFTRHTCLYLTSFDPKKYGIFIVIDSTEEVFPLIEQEILQFLKSISTGA